jgi:ABC-type dipeptide/oligopeptide/nickel transport system ATPase component
VKNDPNREKMIQDENIRLFGRLVVKNYRCFSDESPLVLPLNSGTIALVGANNSGKSTVFRLIYEFQQLWHAIVGHGLVTANEHGSFPTVEGPRGTQDFSEIFCNQNDRALSIAFEFDCPAKDTQYGVPYLSKCVFICKRVAFTWTVEFELSSGERLPSKTLGGFNPANGVFNNFSNESVLRDPGVWQTASLFFNSVYIPADRSLLNLGSGANLDMRYGREAVQFIRSWKTGVVKQQNRAMLDLSKELAMIFNIDTLDISAGTNDEVLFVVNGHPLRQYEVGGGLAQFLACAITLIDKQPKMILIDEPEIGLHPSLQVRLVDFLSDKVEGNLIFSTHSVGLARLAADCCLALSTANEKVTIKPLDSVLSLGSFIGEMSFSTWRDVGFKTLLLVEGPTEIRTIRQWLRALGKETSVALIHGGGSNLIDSRESADQLSEMKRLCENIAVLIDLCEANGFLVHLTNRRATENYFTTSAIQAQKGAKYSALSEFQKLSDAERAWSKNENWQIARNMTKAELLATDVGEFLARLKD